MREHRRTIKEEIPPLRGLAAPSVGMTKWQRLAGPPVISSEANEVEKSCQLSVGMTKKNGCGAFCRCVGEKERLWRAPCATTEFFCQIQTKTHVWGTPYVPQTKICVSSDAETCHKRRSASVRVPKRATNETSRHETILPSERAPSHCALRMTSVPSATLTRRPPEVSVVKPSSSSPSRTRSI